MIVVAGATGNVGGELVRALADTEDVRAIVRDRSATLPSGVEAHIGDLNEVDSILPAFEGARTAFLLSGYPERPRLFAEARRSGLEHVVLLSSGSAEGGNPENAVARYHMDTEADLKSSGLDWTILRPNTFMSNALRWIPQLESGDIVSAPFADVPIAANDPFDIAAVAAEALADPSAHDGQTYRLSGPEPLLPAEQLSILAEVLDRDLELRAQSDSEARAEMEKSMPTPYADAFFAFFRGGEHDESAVRATVRQVTGREPRSFRQWAEEHAEAFQPPLDGGRA